MHTRTCRWSLTLLTAGLLAGCSDLPTGPSPDLDAPRAGLTSTAAAARVRSTLVTGTWSSAAPLVNVFDGLTAEPLSSFMAYANSFTGGVRVAVGDVDGDGIADMVTGTGPGSSQVKVFSGATGAEIRSFLAYGAFTGGVFVAAGDVNGDGHADIVTGAGAGGGPHVKVFSGADETLLASFFAYAGEFTGGVSVAAGDVDGDGRADIVTGAGAGGGSQVKVFSGATGAVLHSLLAYGGFAGAVQVAAGDVTGDGRADVVTGAGAGAPSHVKVFDGATAAEVASFFAYGTFTGGISVAAADVDGDGRADIVTGAGPGGGPHVKVFSGATGAELASFFAYDGAYTGGVFVAAGSAGVEDDPPPATLEAVIDAARQAADDGTLTGVGATASAAAGRLGAWLNMLDTAKALIEAGDVDAACGQLRQAWLRADGLARPDDFVGGAARGDLADAILVVMEELGCSTR